MSDFVILDGLHDARNLIYATWLRSYQANSLATKNIPRDIFFAHHHRVLDGIFEGNPTVKLAVMPESPEVVFGWSVTQPARITVGLPHDKGTIAARDAVMAPAGWVVHYVYVKPAFRRHGVAKALLEHVTGPVVYTHHTYILRDLHKHVAGSAYNPYAIQGAT